MPLVFVHGVATRRTESNKERFDRRVDQRNQFFREITLAGSDGAPYPHDPWNPYWGDLGVKFAWDMASLPRQSAEYESLGFEASNGALEADNRLITKIAKESLEEAVDIIFAGGIEAYNRTDDKLPSEFVAFAARAAEYAQLNPKLDLGDVTNAEFIDLLLGALKDWSPDSSNSLGLAPAAKWGTLGTSEVVSATAAKIKSGLGLIIGVPRNFLSRGALAVCRNSLHNIFAQFIGDVFVYFDDRGTPSRPGEIVQLIAKHINQADQARQDKNDPLIVVGHSMGGVILYDMLTWYREALLPDANVDFLVTVGSQVGLFEEMKRYEANRAHSGCDDGPVGKPKAVGCWLNVFDKTDVLSFLTEPIFGQENVEDLSFSSVTGMLSAHTAYLRRPSFYRRLGKRLGEAAP